MISTRTTQLARWLAWASITILVCIWLVIYLLGDRLWWTVALLYGPRWVWGAALVGIVPQLLTNPRRGFWSMLLGGIVFAFGILDTRLGLGRIVAPVTGNFRVLEFNADGDVGGDAKVSGLVALVQQTNPDVIVLAECSAKTREALKAKLATYALRESSSLCLLAKDEILSWQIRDPMEFWKLYGSGAIVGADLRTKAGLLRLGLVHLATPRRALSKYNDSTQVESMRLSTSSNLEVRKLESQAAREWVLRGDSVPVVVAGDFNLPVESAIYRSSWGDFQNALSATGRGLVRTKRLRLWGIRIDHVLAGPGAKTVRAWVGPDLGSDHLPVIADLLITFAHR